MKKTEQAVAMSRHSYRFSETPAIVVGLCGHGLAVVRALHEGRVPVLALERNMRQPGARTRLARVEQIGDVNGRGLVDALVNLRSRIDCPGQPVLFLTNDTMVRTMAMHWPTLQDLYALSWAHCRESIALLLDKHQLEAYCEKQGCAYPSTSVVRSRDDIDAAMAITGEQAIIKPSKPLSGFKTALPRSREDFEVLIRRHERDLPFLAQRFIPGDDTSIYFCALMLRHGKVLARFDGHKLRSRPMGHTTIAEADSRDDVYHETLRFFAGLDLSGPVSLEVKCDRDGRMWVIEPTVGRTDFWLGLCTANGVNLPLSEYRSQLDLPQAQLGQRNVAVWFNEERDPFGRFWLARHMRLRLGRRRAQFLYLYLNDPGPALLSLTHSVADLAGGLARRLSGSARQRRGLTVERYDHPRALPPDARALLEQAQATCLQLGTHWFTLMIDDALAQGERPGIYVLRLEGRAVAALPVLASGERGAKRLISSLGNFYTSFYSPIVADGVSLDKYQFAALLAGIKADTKGVSRWMFTAMDAESPGYNLLLDAMRVLGLVPLRYFDFGNWYLPSLDWHQYWAGRDGQLRSTAKRRSKRFAERGGHIEIISSPERTDAGIAAYLAVYAASWKHPEPFERFVPNLIRKAAEQGWLRLGVAWLQNKPIAAQIWLIAAGKASIFKLAYDEAHKDLSAGTLLSVALFHEALNDPSVREVDYLSGDDAYKRSWVDQRRERWGIIAYDPRSLRGLVGLLDQIVRRLVRYLIGGLKRRFEE